MVSLSLFLMVCARGDLTFTFISGLREYFSQTDEIHPVPRIPVMHNMINAVSVKKDQMLQDGDSKTKQVDSVQAGIKSLDMVDEESEEDDDYQVPEADLEVNGLFYSHASFIVSVPLC
jgi:hypothetical protein